jgi:DNA-binding CsgD family transcriptional regulator
MAEQNEQPNDTENSALELLQKIKDGLYDPKSLGKSDRQRCVEVLVAEGYTNPQIAQIFKCTDRNIRRDVEDINKRNALTPNVEFAKQLIGLMYQKAMSHHSYLVRLARSKEGSTEAKAGAEYLAWKVLKELIEKMQTLGYLPSRPQEIIGNFFHHGEEDGQDIIQVKNVLSEIETIARQTGTLDADTQKEIELLRSKIEKAELAIEVDNLSKKQSKTIEQKEEKNEQQP